MDVRYPRRSNLLSRRAMHTPAIPADNERAPNPLPQRFDKGDYVGSANVLFLDLEGSIDPPSRGRKNQRADEAQSVVPIPSTLHRSLTRGGPGATVHRLQAEARFVDKNNASSKPAGFF